MIRTSRTLVRGTDAADSLHIARTVSAALVRSVREIVAQVRPAFVLAKGGITSSDTATEGLGIRRAWCRGTMLPGIVSMWEPVSGPAQGIPYIVFAGNVGDDQALAAVLETLRSADVLAHGTGILADALARHSAVPAFATYNLEMVQAVVEAAEQTGKPVIVLAGSSHFKHAGRAALMSIALQAAAESSATIGVHLDHCRDLAEIELCVQAGYSSVMVDGSHLPFGQNIELTRAAVALAHPAGAWVEAELGGDPGRRGPSPPTPPRPEP